MGLNVKYHKFKGSVKGRPLLYFCDHFPYYLCSLLEIKITNANSPNSLLRLSHVEKLAEFIIETRPYIELQPIYPSPSCSLNSPWTSEPIHVVGRRVRVNHACRFGETRAFVILMGSGRAFFVGRRLVVVRGGIGFEE